MKIKKLIKKLIKIIKDHLKKKRKTMIIQTLGYCKFFSNKWKESVTARKTTDSICCQRQNSNFEAKIGILENSYPPVWTWQLLKTFHKINVDFN